MSIPRRSDNDYTREAADQRRAFAEEHTDARLNHVSAYSFDPSEVAGNIENFIGVGPGAAGPGGAAAG